MQLTPQAFYALTPYEFDRLLEAFNRRDQRSLKRQAAWVASLMNATGNMKEAVTVDSLLGTGPTKVGQDMDALRQRAEQRRAERLREREKKRGG